MPFLRRLLARGILCVKIKNLKIRKIQKLKLTERSNRGHRMGKIWIYGLGDIVS